MGRGFTFFDIAFLLLLLGVVGMVAVPGALDRLRVRDEVRAVEALEWVAAAEERFRLSRGWDADGDGKGEFGFLSDLVRTAPRGGDWGECPFGEDSGAPVARLGGFHLVVYLPGEDGRPVTEGSGRFVEPDFAEKTFAAMAWPVQAGRTGYRAYYVNHDLIVLENLNEDGSISGFTPPPPPVPVLASRHPESGSILPPASPPLQWVPFVRREQLEILKSRLGSDAAGR